MKLYVDLETMDLIVGPGFRNPIGALRFKRGDAAQLEVAFLTGGLTPATIGDPAALEIHFGVKPRGRYDVDYLVHSAEWTMPAPDAQVPVYRCTPSFNTEELDSALGVGSSTGTEQSEIGLMGEITWREGDGLPTSTRTFSVIIENDVNRGTEGVPTNAGPVYPAPGSIALLSSVIRHDAAQDLSANSKSQARTNLGLGSAATSAAIDFATAAQGAKAEAALAASAGSYVIAKPGDNLVAKYAEAAALTPNGMALSATNRATLILMPGTYVLSATWALNANYVNVLGLGGASGKPAVRIETFGVTVTGLNVIIANLEVIETFLTATDTAAVNHYHNIVAIKDNAGCFAHLPTGSGTCYGRYTNCIGGNLAFGGTLHSAAGCTDCVGGQLSFGFMSCAGTCIRCVGAADSFGGTGTITGTLRECRLTSFIDTFTPVSGGGQVIACWRGTGEWVFDPIIPEPAWSYIP